MQNKIQAVDLFCGIGGLSYGLKEAGIEVKAGVDLDNSCGFAFNKNVNGEFIGQDIRNVEGNTVLGKWEKNCIKVLVGCAPCQPFSTHSNKNRERKKNEKWNLLNDFLRLVKETNPEIISMENVPNLSNQQIFDDFVRALKNEGYYVSFSNVYCPDYGMAQKRRRLVLLASRFGFIELIKKTHTPDKYVSVREAIGHLPKIKSGKKHPNDPLHLTTKLSEINEKRIKASRQNGSWIDWPEDLKLECHKKKSGASYKSVYGRMSWDEPSPTITTQFYNYGTGRFGHPDQDRALTIREAAILQSFPEDYNFYAEKDDIFITRMGIHIGNAVPVRLGEVIGISIIKHLEHNVR